jgi:hypothetical protein
MLDEKKGLSMQEEEQEKEYEDVNKKKKQKDLKLFNDLASKG